MSHHHHRPTAAETLQGALGILVWAAATDTPEVASETLTASLGAESHTTSTEERETHGSNTSR